MYLTSYTKQKSKHSHASPITLEMYGLSHCLHILHVIRSQSPRCRLCSVLFRQDYSSLTWWLYDTSSRDGASLCGVSLEPLARKKMERFNWGKDRLGPVPVCCWVHWLLVFASGHLCVNF